MSKKSIVLCFDGTWNTPSTATTPQEDDSTNVVRFFKSVRPASDAGQQQLKWYNEGVGTEWYERIRGGAFGLGLDRHIMDGYTVLARNFQDGDDIYLFGFSRGAYTARSLAGFIRNAGILKKPVKSMVDEAYAMYRSREAVDSEHARAFRNAYSRVSDIMCVGVWDTVGALGIPLKPFAEFNADQYKFHDTKLSSSVKNAFHALAIDEHREPYAATLWEPRDGLQVEKGQVLEQVWFSGAHADVGGGYKGTHPIADLSLRWMQKKAALCGLGLKVLDAPKEDAVVASSLHDSFSEFMGGLLSFFSNRYYRPLGRAADGPQHLDVSIRKRIVRMPDYRPKNSGLLDMAEMADAW